MVKSTDSGVTWNPTANNTGIHALPMGVACQKGSTPGPVLHTHSHQFDAMVLFVCLRPDIKSTQKTKERQTQCAGVLETCRPKRWLVWLGRK